MKKLFFAQFPIVQMIEFNGQLYAATTQGIYRYSSAFDAFVPLEFKNYPGDDVIYCKKNEFCCKVEGHDGPCDNIPF